MVGGVSVRMGVGHGGAGARGGRGGGQVHGGRRRTGGAYGVDDGGGAHGGLAGPGRWGGASDRVGGRRAFTGQSGRPASRPRCFVAGGADIATRTNAAWGEVTGFAARPPANHWGARALPQAFDTVCHRRIVGLICEQMQDVEVCTPAPEDALLMEALWWRAIAEGRLARLNHDALRACYDGGGIFGRPDRCEGVPGRGWPTYEPAD